MHAGPPSAAAPPKRELPLQLVFSAVFDGRARNLIELRRLPPATEFRILAQPHPHAVLPARNFSLTFTTSHGDVIDLVSDGNASWVTAPCQDCAARAISAALSLDRVRKLGARGTVAVDALGFQGVLDESDTAALAEWAEQLGFNLSAQARE
jgi:hypothetical protein